MKLRYISKIKKYDYTQTMDYRIKNYIGFGIISGILDNQMKNYIVKNYDLSSHLAKSYILSVRECNFVQ